MSACGGAAYLPPRVEPIINRNGSANITSFIETMTMSTATCRFCQVPLSHTFCDLGLTPFANAYVARDKSHTGEMFYPLHVFVCEACSLVQLEEFESPENIFSEYAYFSGFSTSWLAHAERYVERVSERFELGSSSKVVEVASNDGYLLQYFVRKGIPVLGVEPARNVAAAAISKGVPSEVAFFGVATAERLRRAGHAADLMVANNVLAHVPDILDFTQGFSILLKPEGVGTFEFPHLLRLIEELQFDTIYHEHYSYLSLSVVVTILAKSGLRVFDVEEVATHGGSLRVFYCHEGASHRRTEAVNRVLADERLANLGDLSGYAGFQDKVESVKAEALEFLIRARRQGKSVYGYGAAAKGNTFLSYCGVGPEFVRAVADRSPHKQKTLLPGSRIPVISPEELVAARPDYVLILPWNLKDEVAEQLKEIRQWGGCFVVAIPGISVF